MKAASLLWLLFTVQEGRCSDEDKTYCTEQRGTIIVKEKGSVTIPCNFTYPNPKDKPVDVRVSWRRGGSERCGNGIVIYNHTENWTHEGYRGRISLLGNPNRERTATITITDLKRTDNTTYCCRMEIYEGGKYKEAWQNRHGTYLQFTDEFSVEQSDVVPAMIGEDITIPCLVHYKDPSDVEEVIWKLGSSDLCVLNNEKTYKWNKDTVDPQGRWSVVDFPKDLSLRIRSVIEEDIKQYCCEVRLKRRNDNTASATHGTEVVLVDTTRDPKFEVVQPETTSPDKDGSATISCSYKPQFDSDLLWTGVFWRVGSPSGFYAYHPFPAMVHSNYSGRTELGGLTDLHIKGVNSGDNTTYYCFVMLKFCIGNNEVKSTIRYGRGTKLDLEGTSNADSHSGVDDPDSNTWVYVLAAVLVFLIIICAVVVIILKKRGIICKSRSRSEDVKYLTSNIALKDQNSSGNVQAPASSSRAAPVAQEDSGGVLYADLNVSSLQQRTRMGRKPDDDSQVVYAAVKPTSAPQDIYATVHE